MLWQANTAWSKTNGREPPPTHLADVLGGFRIDSREGSGLKQPECSTKKLMLSNAGGQLPAAVWVTHFPAVVGTSSPSTTNSLGLSPV